MKRIIFRLPAPIVIFISFLAFMAFVSSCDIVTDRQMRRMRQVSQNDRCRVLIDSCISEASAKSFSAALFTNDVEEVSVGFVEKILDEKKIEHSFDDSERKICAIVRNIHGDFVVQTSITMEFLFDSDMKLQYIDVKKAYTGP